MLLRDIVIVTDW
jgi:hypothetical protein